MSAHDQMLYLSRWKGRTIVFGKDAEDLECYPEPGMKAVVVDATRHDDYWVMNVDYRPFDAHNKSLETSNYYDRNGIACLTAREAGFYKPLDRLYLPEVPLWDTYFTAADTAEAA